MEKNNSLKSLAKIIIFIAWINLIAGIIVAIYTLTKNLETLILISSILSGIIGFIVLLAFGKLIQLVIEIRENQFSVIEVKETGKTAENNKQLERKEKIEFSEKTLVELRRLIVGQQQGIAVKNKNEIIDSLSKLISTKKNALDIIVAYEEYFGINIIDELKSLSKKTEITKEYLKKFIEFEIIQNEYPFEKK